MPRPTPGRIVMVRGTEFSGECPGIISGVSEQGEHEVVNVHVLTDHGERLFLTAVRPQSASEASWGWRWPTLAVPEVRVDEAVLARARQTPGAVAVSTPDVPHTAAVSTQEQLARV